MIPETVMLGFRELSEAAIVVAATAVVTRRLSTRHQRRVFRAFLISSVAVGLALLGCLFALDARIPQVVEDVLESALMTGTAAALLIMIVAIARQPEVPPGLNTPSLGSLAGLIVALEVLRELPETVMEAADAGPTMTAGIGGAAVGIALAAALAVALRLALDRLTWPQLRAVLLPGFTVLGASLASHAVEELGSAGLVGLGPTVWDTSEILSQRHGLGRWLRMFVGYSDRPSLPETVAWLGYVGLAVGLVLARMRSGATELPGPPAPVQRWPRR